MSSQSTVSSVISEEDVSSEESGTFNLDNGFLRFQQNCLKCVVVLGINMFSVIYACRFLSESEPNIMDPQQPVLNVAPLNCVPCIGPTNSADIFSSSRQENAEASETVDPAMIFLPSQSTREELKDIMNATGNGVVLTGAALTETMGPRIRKVIGEDLDEDNAFVVMPTFFIDQISDLPEKIFLQTTTLSLEAMASDAVECASLSGTIAHIFKLLQLIYALQEFLRIPTVKVKKMNAGT
ncbi:hypothetical protein PTKIN_Ptkin06aG0203300 [Pterospermum kingtungense]